MTVPTPTAAVSHRSESASAAGSRRRSQQNTTRGTAAPCAQRCTTPETVARTLCFICKRLHASRCEHQCSSWQPCRLTASALRADRARNGCTGRRGRELVRLARE